MILDIGCGAGQTVMQLAELVGTGGRVVGVDIAPLLLDIARERAAALPQASLIEADAQTLDLADQGADAIFSRFGVMAIADPVAAFANFHRMLKPGGRLAFACWRSLEENELDLLPVRAAGLEALVDPTPFGFADAGYVRALLETAGFDQIRIEAHDDMVSSGGLDDMAEVLLRVGALGKILRERPDLRACRRAAACARRLPLRITDSRSGRVAGRDLDSHGTGVIRRWPTRTSDSAQASPAAGPRSPAVECR